MTRYLALFGARFRVLIQYRAGPRQDSALSFSGALSG